MWVLLLRINPSFAIKGEGELETTVHVRGHACRPATCHCIEWHYLQVDLFSWKYDCFQIAAHVYIITTSVSGIMSISTKGDSPVSTSPLYDINTWLR